MPSFQLSPVSAPGAGKEVSLLFAVVFRWSLPFPRIGSALMHVAKLTLITRTGNCYFFSNPSGPKVPRFLGIAKRFK